MNVAFLKDVAPSPEDWPELVPLDAPDLPRLDLAHLPGWAGGFARALAADTETPPELTAGMVLATCATAAARRLRVKVNLSYFEPCNLWLIAALPSGTRKSAVQSAATAPLVAWERDQAMILEPKSKRIASERKTLEVRAKEQRSQAAREKDSEKAKELGQEVANLEAALPEVPPAAAHLDIGRHPGAAGNTPGRTRRVHGLAVIGGGCLRPAARPLLQRHPQPGPGAEGA